MKKTKTNLEIKKQTLSELLIKYFPTKWTSDIIEGINWLDYLFQENKINPAEFLAWNNLIKCKSLIKINALILQGHTNAGKSLIIDTLIEPLKLKPTLY